MLDQAIILALLKEKGKVYIKEGNGKIFSLRKGSLAEKEILEKGFTYYLIYFKFERFAFHFLRFRWTLLNLPPSLRSTKVPQIPYYQREQW